MTTNHAISPETVRALPAVQLVDCRFRLGQHGAGLELYRDGHIPGALYLDLDDDLSGPMREDRLGGRHPLPERGAFEQSLQRAGLCSDAPIVVYDDGTGGAARAWWLLRHHGVASQVLVGGIAAWDDELDVGDPSLVSGDLVQQACRWRWPPAALCLMRAHPNASAARSNRWILSPGTSSAPVTHRSTLPMPLTMTF